jgi:hypothetical protein
VAHDAGIDSGKGVSRPLLRCGADRCRHSRRTGPSRPAWEQLLTLSELPFPAGPCERRVFRRGSVVEFEGSRYRVAPVNSRESVEVRTQLGWVHLKIHSKAG